VTAVVFDSPGALGAEVKVVAVVLGPPSDARPVNLRGVGSEPHAGGGGDVHLELTGRPGWVHRCRVGRDEADDADDGPVDRWGYDANGYRPAAAVAASEAGNQRRQWLWKVPVLGSRTLSQGVDDGLGLVGDRAFAASNAEVISGIISLVDEADMTSGTDGDPWHALSRASGDVVTWGPSQCTAERSAKENKRGLLSDIRWGVRVVGRAR
jgi:hypothetical protein